MICFYYFLYRCMKNRIFYLFLIITLVLTACDQKLKNKSALISNIRVDFSEASFENFKRLNVVDTTLLIALAEDVENDLVLGQLDKIIILNDTIYIADTYLKRLLMYDMQGNILGKIGNLGGGPGEFASLSDFCVKKDGSIYIYDSASNKILVYGKESNFLRDYPISFKAEQFQATKDGFLFGLAPYNQDDMTLGKQIAYTDNEFALLATALEYDKNIDSNYEFFSPMIPVGDDVIYNRVINNNIYILGSRGENKQILHFDFGDYNIVAEDLKDINALLDSDKDYCYIACPPVMIDSMIMGVLNKKGELYTFIYDQKRDEMALNRLADFSCKNINLPITSIGSNFLVSYFNKDIYSSYSQSDELNFELKNKIDQGAFVLCLSKIRGEI